MTRKQAGQRRATSPRCAECGKPFTPTDTRVAPQQLYCSNKCKMKNYWRRRLAKEQVGTDA